VAQGRDQWLVLLNTVISIRIAQKAAERVFVSQ
jgi:hypothetical protein